MQKCGEMAHVYENCVRKAKLKRSEGFGKKPLKLQMGIFLLYYLAIGDGE